MVKGVLRSDVEQEAFQDYRLRQCLGFYPRPTTGERVKSWL